MNTETALRSIKLHAGKMAGEYLVDGENQASVNKAAAWLAREPMEGMDPNKGILLIGHVGTGKTLLMRAVRAAMSDIWGVQFGIKPCTELVRDFSDCGYEGVETWMNAPHVCFDDIGTEGEAIHFGKRTTLMAEVIEARYNRLTSGLKCWTHLTTNLGATELKTAYGERAYSRLLHMCNILDIGAARGATDRRKVAPAPLPSPVNADNVYQVVHPSIAARLSEAIGPLAKGMRVVPEDPSDRPAFTAEQMLASFAESLTGHTPGELNAMRSMLIKEHPINTHGNWEATRRVALIDAELEARKPKDDEHAKAS